MILLVIYNTLFIMNLTKYTIVTSKQVRAEHGENSVHRWGRQLCPVKKEYTSAIKLLEVHSRLHF